MKRPYFILLIICSHALLNADIIFKKHVIGSKLKATMCIIAVDIDKDGDKDIISASSNKNGALWWENNGKQHYKKHILGQNYGAARTVYAADLDRDGHMDILAAGYRSGKLTWFRNDGKQGFTENTISNNLLGAHTVSTADLDGDGDIDVMGSSFTPYKKGETRTGKLTWYENDGNQQFKEHLLAKNITTCVFGYDIDKDGDIDILASLFQVNQIAWWQNNGKRRFKKQIVSNTFPGPHWARAVDLDQDGDIDIIGAGLASHVSWWRNDGLQRFTECAISTDFAGASSVYACDMDNDGDIDVFSTSEQNHDIRWWENNGKQEFTEHTISGLFPGASDVYVADVDLDGDMDVLGAGNIENQICWWENRGKGEIDRNQIRSEDAFFTYIRTKGTKKALILYPDIKNKIELREAYLETLGYEFLGKKRKADAINIFKLNAMANPESANVYFALAEGYIANKEVDKAKEYYQKAKTFPADSIKILKFLRLSLLLKDRETSINLVSDLKKNNAKKHKISEFRINFLGYQLLNQGHSEDAIVIFIAGTELFPKSFNAYDSLGEAYMKNGQRDLAIKNYKKSLELNPQNRNAVEVLKKLK